MTMHYILIIIHLQAGIVIAPGHYSSLALCSKAAETIMQSASGPIKAVCINAPDNIEGV